ITKMKEKRQNVYEYSFEMQQKRQKRTNTILALMLGIFLFLTIFLNFVMFPIHIKSDTMEDGLTNGGIALVCPLIKSPERGDLFFISRMDGYKNSILQSAIESFINFFTLQKISPFSKSEKISGQPMVRRVIALPGDSIYMKDFVLYIKPASSALYLTEFELSKKSYNVQIFSIPAEWNNVGVSGELEEMTLGDGEYFVLADNRVECLDSRQWGPINYGRLQGRVLLQYFPINSIRTY
ncbi:MAG: signal peptidase I, partial [Treponema sp.]|nr:signal peptidase I [Treponema sp.]